jgi:hypothetical protein
LVPQGEFNLNKTFKAMLKKQGEIVKINEVPSSKLGLFSVIVGFRSVTETKLGKQVILEDYVGIAFFEELPDVAVGDKVNCEVGEIRSTVTTDLNTGETITRKSAPTVVLSLVEERVEAAAKPAATTRRVKA